MNWNVDGDKPKIQTSCSECGIQIVGVERYAYVIYFYSADVVGWLAGGLGARCHLEATSAPGLELIRQWPANGQDASSSNFFLCIGLPLPHLCWFHSAQYIIIIYIYDDDDDDDPSPQKRMLYPPIRNTAVAALSV